MYRHSIPVNDDISKTLVMSNLDIQEYKTVLAASWKQLGIGVTSH